jgi:lipid A ethanolaminephosphotransferase
VARAPAGRGPGFKPWPGAWAALLLALAVLVGALLAVYQPMSSLMRNQKELRYLITPGNVLWSLGVVVAANTRGAAKPRQVIGEDAQAGPRLAARSKPAAGGAGGGRNRARRQLGPQRLRAPDHAATGQLPVISFAEVTSCGTNTEVSLPCMFAPVGRRDYDEGRVRGSQSLLHVLARAGVGVHWRDNQSGCKGVCEGLPQEMVKLDPHRACAATAAAWTKPCWSACLNAWPKPAAKARHATAGAAHAGQPRAVVLPPLPAGL